jgi:hypothetical protein
VDSIQSRNLTEGGEYNHGRPIVSLFYACDVKNTGKKTWVRS